MIQASKSPYIFYYFGHILPIDTFDFVYVSLFGFLFCVGLSRTSLRIKPSIGIVVVPVVISVKTNSDIIIGLHK